MYVFSIPKVDLDHTTTRERELSKTVVKLFVDKQIAQGSTNTKITKEIYDNFKDQLCVTYALVNSYGMIGSHSEGSNHLIQVGGNPNIWIVSNCEES